jgi:prepilin-type N-terminal cleavage/methylation domain-containing protein
MIHTRSRRPHRPGFTLRELTIALAVGGTVMMTAAGLLHHAFDWAKIARHRRADDQTFFHLSRQLRSDIHTASGASFGDETEASDSLLKLTVEDEHVVIYRIRDGLVTRQENRDGERLRHESYRWKHPRTLSFGRSESDDQIKLEIKSLTPFSESDVPLWRSFRASLGLRLRHQNGDIAS